MPSYMYFDYIRNYNLFMAKYRKKYVSRKHSSLRLNRSGEDIDMLNERSYEEKGSGAYSTSYKNHIDGA